MIAPPWGLSLNGEFVLLRVVRRGGHAINVARTIARIVVLLEVFEDSGEGCPNYFAVRCTYLNMHVRLASQWLGGRRVVRIWIHARRPPTFAIGTQKLNA